MRMLIGSLGLVLFACGGNQATPDATPDVAIDAPTVPAFRNPVEVPDDQLAMQAMQILGADVPGAQASSCNTCHALTRQHLRYWRALGEGAMSTCLTDLQVATADSARTMLDCLRSMPEVETSSFEVKKLGIYASAGRLPWFEYTFWRAYGPDAPAQRANFIATAAMPHDDTVTPLTQAQFDIVAEWFVRGQPKLDALLPQDPAPTTCLPGISSDVTTHVASLATTGWRAVNHDNAMAMFDCGAATDPRQCLTHQGLGTDQAYGTGWDLPGKGQLRVLKDVTYKSSYWTRSSPDGRFVAHGVKNTSASTIIDLQNNATIAVAALYDPGFFPDNTGFVFQGGTRNTCPLNILLTDPANVSMTETGCTKYSQIGLYQHVGRALGGGDYFTIDSEFVSDDGGHTPTHGDPSAYFGPHAIAYFNPFMFDGVKYVAHTQVEVPQAYEGDSVLSPSATLELTRVSDPNNNQIGYVLRKVVATPSGDSYTIETPEIARYCLSGGKVGFSYDERWIVYHHYVTSADAVELGFTGPSDPAFAPYLSQGAANLYLMDLRTGIPVRITNMHPGQYALFPHFRSDGWIYADVRDDSAVHEYIVASDAALIAEQP